MKKLIGFISFLSMLFAGSASATGVNVSALPSSFTLHQVDRAPTTQTAEKANLAINNQDEREFVQLAKLSPKKKAVKKTTKKKSSKTTKKKG